MIQYKQPKKVKGARKKAREEAIERLQLQYPTWFEGRTDKEIRDLVNAFRLTGRPDEEFPTYCIEYETEMEKIKKELLIAYDEYIMNRVGRPATSDEYESVQKYIDEISVPTGVNFNDYI